MYFLIVAFGFILAMRGRKSAPLQKPVEGFAGVWREAADLLLTAWLTLILLAVAAAFEKTQNVASEYSVLSLGVAAYLLSRYQKKADVFFLATIAIVFMVNVKQRDLFHGLFLAWAVCVGMAFFQTAFLGCRYKLLFSRIPSCMKGWPLLCLLAAFISAILVGSGRLVF